MVFEPRPLFSSSSSSLYNRKYAVITTYLQLLVLLSWQRTTPRPATHVASPVANCNDRARMLQCLTIDTAVLAVRKRDANDLVRNRLVTVLKTILHQNVVILADLFPVYVINSNYYTNSQQ